MKYFYIIIMIFASTTSFAKEVCMDEDKLNDFQQHIELLLTPKLSIKSNISKILTYTVVRDELNPQTQSKSYNIIDNFTNHAISELYFGLSQTDHSVYENEFKRDIHMIIKGLLASRKTVPVDPINKKDYLDKLVNFVQYDTTLN